jgi:RNA polymerase sigma-70 factor (ECF subfamily)
MRLTDPGGENRENELVRRLRRREPAAMEELYNLYKDQLHSLVSQQVARDCSAAEDVVQDTFLAALSSIDRFRGDSQLYTWLCSIALHKVTDLRRYQARHPPPEKCCPAVDLSKLPDIQDETPTAASTMEREETSQRVQRALVDLPPEYRKVLQLKYLEDMSISEISRAMKRSQKSVEGLLYRARRALRSKLVADSKER